MKKGLKGPSTSYEKTPILNRKRKKGRKITCENAADAPNVDGSGVSVAAHQNVGGSVPERDDFVGVGPHGDSEGPFEKKEKEK